MLKLFRLSPRISWLRVGLQGILFAAFPLSALYSAHGQTTFASRQLERLDIAVGGDGVFTKSVAGTNYLGQPVSLDASTTVGAVVQARYTKSPLLGLEFTYTYARFNEKYSVAPGGVQTNASGYTLGYVAHLPTLFGVEPFASVGGGVTAFKPTPMGGQGLPEQGRASYYYDVGADDQLTRYFGVRAQFRQVFHKAPDFGANYLGINQQTFTTEPTIGIYIKF